MNTGQDYIFYVLSGHAGLTLRGSARKIYPNFSAQQIMRLLLPNAYFRLPLICIQGADINMLKNFQLRFKLCFWIFWELRFLLLAKLA